MESEFLIYLIVGIVVVLIFLIVFIYYKDIDNRKKTRVLEKSIEDLHHELYKVEKKLKDMQSDTHTDLDGKINNFDYKIKESIDREMKTSMNQLTLILNGVEKSFQYFKSDIDLKFHDINERLKGVLTMPSSSSVTTKDENRVLELHNSGKTSEEIAKELKINKGEIDFMLNLSNMNEPNF